MHQKLVYWKKIAAKIGISPKRFSVLIKVYARTHTTNSPKGQFKKKNNITFPHIAYYSASFQLLHYLSFNYYIRGCLKKCKHIGYKKSLNVDLKFHIFSYEFLHHFKALCYCFYCRMEIALVRVKYYFWVNCMQLWNENDLEY